jgi:hypothetical protein
MMRTYFMADNTSDLPKLYGSAVWARLTHAVLTWRSSCEECRAKPALRLGAAAERKFMHRIGTGVGIGK